jgi:hypothetical protein
MATELQIVLESLMNKMSSQTQKSFFIKKFKIQESSYKNEKNNPSSPYPPALY